MQSEWFKGVRDNAELKEERRIQLVTSTKAFEILTGILEERIKSKDTERNSVESYTSPSYPYLQADSAGYIRALKEVQRLINLKDKES